MSKENQQSDLKRSLGFLIGRIHRVLRRNTEEVLARVDVRLSPEELSILTVLARIELPERMEALAEFLERNPTTLKRQLDGLVEAGLVTRTQSRKDRRCVLISTTRKGQALAEGIMPDLLMLRERALEGMSTADREKLLLGLSAVLENLRRTGEPEPETRELEAHVS